MKLLMWWQRCDEATGAGEIYFSDVVKVFLCFCKLYFSERGVAFVKLLTWWQRRPYEAAGELGGAVSVAASQHMARSRGRTAAARACETAHKSDGTAENGTLLTLGPKKPKKPQKHNNAHDGPVRTRSGRFDVRMTTKA